MDLGHRVRDLRNARHLSQIELAARAGVARNTLNRIENGHLMPTAPVIEHLAEALGVAPGTLFEEPALAGKAEAPQETGPSERAALSDEDRLRLLTLIASTATALNGQFEPKVDAEAKDFTIEKYEQVGETFVLLDVEMAHSAPSDYIHSAEASGAVRKALSRAWVSMDALQRTLQRAREELMRREAAGVPSIEELKARRDVA
jgi:transcriptional regulator with XRE-family HTH domain